MDCSANTRNTFLFTGPPHGRSWFANHPWPWRAWIFGPCKRRPCGATGECGAENLKRKSALKWPSQERIAAVKPRIHLYGHYHLGTWLGMIRIGVIMWGHNISYNRSSLGRQFSMRKRWSAIGGGDSDWNDRIIIWTGRCCTYSWQWYRTAARDELKCCTISTKKIQKEHSYSECEDWLQS